MKHIKLFEEYEQPKEYGKFKRSKFYKFFRDRALDIPTLDEINNFIDSGLVEDVVCWDNTTGRRGRMNSLVFEFYFPEIGKHYHKDRYYGYKTYGIEVFPRGKVEIKDAWDGGMYDYSVSKDEMGYMMDKNVFEKISKIFIEQNGIDEFNKFFTKE